MATTSSHSSASLLGSSGCFSDRPKCGGSKTCLLAAGPWDSLSPVWCCRHSTCSD